MTTELSTTTDRKASTATPTWLLKPGWIPQIALQQATAICDRLSADYPEWKSEFEANLKSLKTDLDSLVKMIKSGAEKSLLTSEPCFKFLTRASGCEDIHMLWFDVPKSWADVKDEFENRRGDSAASVMLWPATPPAAIKSELEKANVSCVVLDPLDRRPETGDYLSVMKANIAKINGLFE